MSGMVMMQRRGGGKWIGEGPKASQTIIASIEACTVDSTGFDRGGRTTEHQFGQAVASNDSGSIQPHLVELGLGPAGHQHLVR